MKGLLIIAAKKRKGKTVLLTCNTMAQTKYSSHRLAEPRESSEIGSFSWEAFRNRLNMIHKQLERMTFKNLFLSLLGMLVVYHCAEMESPLKDITASCLLKHKVDDGLKGFAASRAVTDSLVQLRSGNNCAASTSCTELNQPG